MTDDGYFGEHGAATYDESSGRMFDPAVVQPTVDFLARLAGDGRALELGIGTGRIAIPLAARGIEVHGIELSKAMIDRLRAKPGGQGIGAGIRLRERWSAWSREPFTSASRQHVSVWEKVEG